MVFLRRQVALFGEMCAEPLFAYFSKYIRSNIRSYDNNPDKCFQILKKSMSIQHFQTKLGITKYSIVTNSNDSVTLRLMTEHDLRCSMSG